MPIQQSRHSKSKRDKRRSHHALTAKCLVQCPNCGESMQPHHACPHCGSYRGRQVLTVKEEE